MSDPGLQASGLVQEFGEFRALDGVSVEIGKGDIVGLIGPNGSGKTTLINVLSGLYRCSAGTVRVGGREITSLAPHKRAQAGISRTFQNVRLFAHLSVLENVEASCALHDSRPWSVRRRPQAREILAELGLATLADREAGTLPYGDQRRVEIARALATAPSFVLLDEPAAGMLPTESDELVAVLSSVQQRHSLGLLVIDHDLRLINQLCPRVLVMNAGQILTDGTPTEVHSDPRVIEAYLGREAASAADQIDPSLSQLNPTQRKTP